MSVEVLVDLKVQQKADKMVAVKVVYLAELMVLL